MLKEIQNTGRWLSLADSSLKIAGVLGGPKCGAALPMLAVTCLAELQLFVYSLLLLGN